LKPKYSGTSFTQKIEENDDKLVADNFWLYLKNKDLLRVRELEELIIETQPNLKILC